MKVKKCAIFNYIPHDTPKYLNYSLWYKTYYDYLVHMHSMSNNMVKNRYTDMPNIDFENFCMFIYKYSSKYIQI